MNEQKTPAQLRGPEYIAVNMRDMRRLMMQLEQMKVQLGAAMAAYNTATQRDLFARRKDEVLNGVPPQNVSPQHGENVQSEGRTAPDIVPNPPDHPEAPAVPAADDPYRRGNSWSLPATRRAKACASPSKGKVLKDGS